MNFKHTKLTKILVVFFCLSFFLSSFGSVFLTPKKAEAQAFVPVWEVGQNLVTNLATTKSTAFLEWKEYIGDGIIWEIVKKLIKSAVIDVILNEIATLFGTEPAFVTNPFIFLRDLEIETSDDVLNDLLDGYFTNAFFGTSIQDILTDKHLPSDYQLRLDSILDSTIENDVTTLGGDFTEFKDGNFYEGGWAGFFSLTQNAKNNPYGSYLQAENTLAKSNAEAESLALEELSWGNGFLSDRDNGMITLPGITISDQLNEVLGNELRTLEHADEITEALALLAGTLISNIFSSGGLAGGGSFASINTSYDETAQASAPSGLGDTTVPGGGTVVTFDGTLTCFDIDDASLLAHDGSLRGIDLDNSDRMEMVNPTNSNPDNTIQVGASNEVSIPSLTFVRATGGTFDIGGAGFGPFKPAGEVITLNNVTVQNPIFGTLNSSVVANSGSITGALVTNTPPVDPNLTGEVGFQVKKATKACLTDGELILDDAAAGPNDYINAIITGIGSSVDNLFDITNISSGLSSLSADDLLRGGTTNSGVITLNNVRLLGGTVVTSTGATYTISNPSDNLYCSVLGPCNYNQSTSGITGATLYINDSARRAWSIKSITWPEPRSAFINGNFDIFNGTVTNTY